MDRLGGLGPFGTRYVDPTSQFFVLKRDADAARREETHARQWKDVVHPPCASVR